ncbi:ABC transporter permease subunit, partial [Streptomyces sp. URMC 123]|uniref:branched-chain amino acid ABC transporter permease n=1 Tax=Streptomyces sp. URMC 123 TaxID=3423403 RepID=UPI003F1B12B5
MGTLTYDLTLAGLAVGSAAALTGIGLIVTYRATGVLNFAHGAIAMVAAYVMRQCAVEWQWPLPLAAAFTLLVVAPALGLALDAVVFRPLSLSRDLTGAGPARTLVASLGVFVLLVGAAGLIWGRGARADAPALLPADPWVQLGTAVAMAAGVGAVTRWTRFGRELRAVVDNRPLAVLGGIDADRVASAGWAFGAFTAGLTGVLLAPHVRLDPYGLPLLVMEVMAVAVAAGMRSLPVAVAVALAIGVAQSQLTRFHPHGWAEPLLQAVGANLFVVALLVAALALPGITTPAPKATRPRLTERLGGHLGRAKRATPPGRPCPDDPPGPRGAPTGDQPVPSANAPSSPPERGDHDSVRKAPDGTTDGPPPAPGDATDARTPRTQAAHRPSAPPEQDRGARADAPTPGPRHDARRPADPEPGDTPRAPAAAAATRSRRLRSRAAAWGPAPAWIVCGVLFLLPLGLAGSDLHTSVQVPALGIVLLSLVVVTGRGGQLSLGQAAYAGLGALFTALLAAGRFPGLPALPELPALACAVVLVAPLGLLTGWPAIRRHGLALALATLAFGVAVSRFVFVQPYATAGLGLGRPAGFGDDRAYYALELLVLGGALAAVVALRRGRAGRALAAMRDHEAGAAAAGVPVPALKLAAFVAGAALAALGGGLLGMGLRAFDPNAYDPVRGLLWFAAVLVLGADSLLGAMAAAALLVGLDAGARGGVAAAVIGVLAVLLGRFPEGLAGAARSALRRAVRPRAPATLTPLGLRVRARLAAAGAVPVAGGGRTGGWPVPGRTRTRAGDEAPAH